MLHIQKQLSGLSYCLTLLMCCCWILNSDIAYGQQPEGANTVQEVEDTDRVYEFEVGQIESFSKETITVNGQHFLITVDTQFTDSEGTSLNDISVISEGVEVAVSFYPYEDTALAVELLPDENYDMPLQKKTYPKAKKRKKDVIVFEKGVYKN